MIEEVNHDAIAREIYYFMETATGDCSMDLANQGYEDWKQSYGKKFADLCKDAKKKGRDFQGSMADALFNADGFWDMAQDRIGDELSKAGVGWKDPTRLWHWNKVCDALAKQADFKSTLILSWKRKG